MALVDILNGQGDEVLENAVEKIKATAERMAAEIQAAFIGSAVCYVASFNLNPPFYATMRAHHLPPVIKELGLEFGDYTVNIYGFAAFRMMLVYLLAICPFRAVVISHLGFELIL